MNMDIQTSARGGTGSFADGELSSKRQKYLFLMHFFWHISFLHNKPLYKMTMFTQMLEPLLRKTKYIYIIVYVTMDIVRFRN